MARSTVPADHSEFGGGPGMIDPVMREERVFEPYGNAEPHTQLWEIYATDPAPPQSDGPPFAEQELPLGPENFPETATVERP